MGTIRDDIEQVLLSETQIQQRLDQLAATLEQDYAQRNLTLVGLLSGSVIFLADLLRRLRLPLRLDYLGVASYHGQTCSTGQLSLTKQLQLDVRGHDVLVVDDVLDSGLTLAGVRQWLAQLGPRSLRTCVLLEKDLPHHNGFVADYVGFKIPDLFVVGYGLDYQQRYRNLPFVGTLKPAVLASPSKHHPANQP